MRITKKYGSRLCAENWREYCLTRFPNKEILIFRDLYKNSSYYVGVLREKNGTHFVLDCGFELPRDEFTVCW